jgi:macrolide-specific efflux system membrane fusion protein
MTRCYLFAITSHSFAVRSIAMLLLVRAAGVCEGAPGKAEVPHCLVSLIEEVQIPAQEAGVLSELKAQEGDQVETGALLAQIDDKAARHQRDVAVAERAISEAKAKNDVNVRYADATRRVAASEYQLNVDANVKVPGTKSAVELQKLLLTVEQAKLQIEQAEHEQRLAGLETDANTAKVSLAEDDIRRRSILAPVNGEVVETLFRAGEWVKPGDPVIRIVRLDRLRVEAFLNAEQFSPGEVKGRAVEVTVRLERGRVEKFAGRVVFVDPRVQAGGEYRIWAEVDNRQNNGQWLLRPGLSAVMTIDLESERVAEKGKS